MIFVGVYSFSFFGSINFLELVGFIFLINSLIYVIMFSLCSFLNLFNFDVLMMNILIGLFESFFELFIFFFISFLN